MYLFAELFQALCPPCHKHQLASLLRKRNSTRCADTTACASDEHNLTGDVYAHRCVLGFSACRVTPLPLQERKALWQAMLRCCTVWWKLVKIVKRSQRLLSCTQARVSLATVIESNTSRACRPRPEESWDSSPLTRLSFDKHLFQNVSASSIRTDTLQCCSMCAAPCHRQYGLHNRGARSLPTQTLTMPPSCKDHCCTHLCSQCAAVACAHGHAATCASYRQRQPLPHPSCRSWLACNITCCSLPLSWTQPMTSRCSTPVPGRWTPAS